METEEKKLSEIIIHNLIENFKKRQFDPYFFEKKEDAINFFFSNISKEDSIGYGGSRTISELKIVEKLRSDGYNLLDRNNEANTQEMRAAIERKIFSADVFISSVNAISLDGNIVNIDLFGNRVGAISFGPKNVYLFISYKKIVQDLNSAIFRAKNIAAPLNAIRLNKNTPCTKIGRCVDCFSSDRICASMTIIDWCHPKDRIKLLLINEDLGF